MKKCFLFLPVDEYDYMRILYFILNAVFYIYLFEQELILELYFSRILKLNFYELTLFPFWLFINIYKTQKPIITDKSINTLLLFFSITYICKLNTSALTNIKISKMNDFTSQRKNACIFIINSFSN